MMLALGFDWCVEKNSSDRRRGSNQRVVKVFSKELGSRCH